MYQQLEKEDWDVLADLASQIALIVIDDLNSGKDDESEKSFEEKALYEKFLDQLEMMEEKYGPHPIILDTKADFADDPNEQIFLKKEAISLCAPTDYGLRGSIKTDLAEIYADEKKDTSKALQTISEAISDLEQESNGNDLEKAIEIRERILRL